MASIRTARRTLGPVTDLERHLPADWWRKNTTAEVDLLVQSAGLEWNSRILDLCCGQGRHALELARRGFVHVAGLDRSRTLIRLAKSRARRERRLEVRLVAGASIDEAA